MEPELDSITIDDKTARPGEERVFHFGQVSVFAEFEMELSRRFQVLQRFGIREQRRDPLRCDVSIYDGIDERWPEVTPALVTARLLCETRHQLLFQGSSDRRKINARTYCRGIARSYGGRESPKRKVRRRAVNQQKDNADDHEPADEFHLESDQL